MPRKEDVENKNVQDMFVKLFGDQVSSIQRCLYEHVEFGSTESKVDLFRPVRATREFSLEACPSMWTERWTAKRETFNRGHC